MATASLGHRSSPILRTGILLSSLYIHHFSNIAKPLHALTEKATQFLWTDECTTAFNTLNELLTHTPILTYPQFQPGAPPFTLLTDASTVGLGAVLEQGGMVIAYASRSLNKAEQNYSTIQKECLAIFYSLKQFRHYLLGRPFTVLTDHAPLQWLSAQKMEGLLCRWALAIQEYSFSIQYRKGSLHTNADALSRRPNSSLQDMPLAATQELSTEHKEELHQAQQGDPTIKKLFQALAGSSTIRPTRKAWHGLLLSRYRQLWSQLCLVDDIVCRKYSPGPTSDTVTVPILPPSLQREVLKKRNHDAPMQCWTFGHDTDT